MAALYDVIGRGYADLRKPDPRIAAPIRRALGDAQSVLNVGAGAGSYEPDDLDVTALEPSVEMIRQRPPGGREAVKGVAEAIPFPDDGFDAAMGVLTVHHWTDAEAGLAEMQRVARKRIVILTFDANAPFFWLADYIPALVALDKATMPPLSLFERVFSSARFETVPIPHDCTDGFLGAYWRRPAAYLDPRVRAAISSFAKITDVSDALSRLRADLESGRWEERYGHLLTQDALDIGYRLMIAELD